MGSEWGGHIPIRNWATTTHMANFFPAEPSEIILESRGILGTKNDAGVLQHFFNFPSSYCYLKQKTKQ